MLRDDLWLIAGAMLLYRPLDAVARANIGRLGLSSQVRAGLLVVIALAWAALPPIDHISYVRTPAWFALFVVTWRTATRDYDVTLPLAPQRQARLHLLAAAALGSAFPPLLLEWLWVALGQLAAWEHHAFMAIRVIQMFLTAEMASVSLTTLLAAAGLSFRPTATGHIILLSCVVLSHYLRPGLDKLTLGYRPWDWLLRNRTHYIAAAAYHWGWANFIPSSSAFALIARLAPFDIVMNSFTLASELLCVLGMLHPWALAASLGALVILHMGIFIASGILFWESALVCLVFAATVLLLPLSLAEAAFGPDVLMVSLAVLALPVLAGRPWRPNRLAWWDTPLACRVRWEVEGLSGSRYGLYNNFMCPFEREYGRTPGLFLVTEPIVHGHLGIVWDYALLDSIVVSRGDPQALSEIRSRWGTSFYDPVQVAQHERFLVEMLSAVNSGVSKRVLPHPLRWLKAPGGQIFYWGRAPAYNGQEPIKRVFIYYTEYYFDWEHGSSRLLQNLLLRTVDL
jgi:hypothetical protein